MKEYSVQAPLISVDSDLRFSPSQTGAMAGTSILRWWLHIDDSGSPAMVEVDKHRLVADLNVRYRDLLTLDPSVPMPFPASLLIREKALVINLETVRLIICANQVYVLSVPKAGQPKLASHPTPSNPFVQQLCAVLRAAAESRRGMMPGAPFDAYSGMPYELRALECALAEATRQMDAEVLELEREAYPAIDRMAVSVSRAVLEDVRAAKSTMNKLIGRVQRVKQELEEILADDVDMQDMYLGRRAALDGKPLPPQPTPMLSPRRAYKTEGNLVELEQREPAAGARARSPSAAVLRGGGAAEGAHEGEGAGVPAEPVAGPRATRLARVSGSGVDWDNDKERQRLERAFTERERAATERSLSRQRQRDGGGTAAAGGGGGAGASGAGGAHDGLRGRGGTQLRRHSFIIRTVRHLRSGGGGRRGEPRRQRQRRELAATPEHERVPEGAGGDIIIISSSSSDASSESEGEEGEGSVHGGGSPRSSPRGSPRGYRRPGSRAGSRESDEDEGGSVIEETVVEHPGAALVDPHDIEEAEDLLESYFMQVDYLLRRVLLLKERIDDTEDLVNIEMDHRRNELVALDLFVTCVTAAFTFVAMVAGVFGMNLYNVTWQSSQAFFISTMVLMGLLAIFMLAAILVYIRKRRLMFIAQTL